jgi:chromosome partitioning protein
LVALAGGQGKTTSAYFISMLLARRGKRVLAIDSNPQADLTLYLDTEPAPDRPSLFEAITEAVEVEDSIYETKHENLFIIPADRSLFKADTYLASSGSGASILRLRLEAIADLFDFAIIDVQPTRSQIALSAVGAAGCVFIPAEANAKGFYSTTETLSFLAEQSKLRAFSGDILGIVPFRDRWVGLSRTKKSQRAIDDIADFAANLQIFSTIRESDQFEKALCAGKLLSDMDRSDLQYPFEQMVEVLIS